MEKYYCHKCMWSGHFPNVVKVESKDGSARVIKYLPFCPDCDNDKLKTVTK